MTRIRLASLFAMLIGGATLCASCGSEDPGASAGAAPQSPVMIEPIGWYKVSLQANYAKTSMDNAGHFTTDRNACGRSAYGALNLDIWNQLATVLNKAAAELLKPTALREPSCVTIENPGKLDGTAELFLDGSKRVLVQMRGYDACTLISDPNLAREVYRAVDLLVLSADKEDCPFGWGSG